MSVIYPLVRSPFDQDDIQTMIKSIESDQFTMGDSVRRFEREFAEKIGSRYAVMVNSGSSANLIAAFAFLYTSKLKIREKDEVLVPAIGWATTWSPLHYAGLNLKVVDVNPRTLNVDFQSYVNAVTEKTKMIATVSVLGNPVDLLKLRKFCDEKDIILFEDNCESIGATIDSRQCGTFGHVGTFSFFYSHHISTIEGGMAVTDDEELYHVLLSLRAHGWVRDLPSNSKIKSGAEHEMREQYHFVFPGFNVRPMNICGALGSKQLLKLDANVESRRKNAELFRQMMQKHLHRFDIQEEEKFGKSSYFSFPIIIKNADIRHRDALFDHLRKFGIESRMITGGCLTKHPMSKHFRYSDYATPLHAEKIHDTGVFVANHAGDMTEMFHVLDRALESFHV